MDLNQRINSIISAFVAAQRSLKELQKEITDREFKVGPDREAAQTRLAHTLETAPERLKQELERLARPDPNFAHADGFTPMHIQFLLIIDALNDKLKHILEEFNTKVVEELKSAIYTLSFAHKLNNWNLVASNTLQDTVATLVQLYQRQHQPIPISRAVQEEIEERDWKPCKGGQYKGHWKDGKRHGHGVFKADKGDHYEGEWKDDQRHGLGVLTQHDKIYEGDWVAGKRNGYGEYRDSGRGTYKGEWSNDMRHGHGRYAWQNGDTYEGEWAQDQEHGYGVKIEGGIRKSGEWRKGQYLGSGPLVLSPPVPPVSHPPHSVFQKIQNWFK